MPRKTLTSSNKIQSGGPDFPKLKLKNGERARIIAGLEEPDMHYVHTLRKPKIEDGVVVTETTTREGTTRTQMVKDFVSRPLCTGDFDVLEEQGIDPEGCVICALAKEDAEYAEAPEPRYALNVFRYRTKGSSFDVTSPFSGEVVVWAFSQRVFNKLVDVSEEFGGLKANDLNLGPCENETFQKFDIAVAGKAAWRQDDGDKKFVAESFKENALKDLSVACGQKKETRWLMRDISDIRDAWAIVRGNKSQAKAKDDTSLDGDLNTLLDSAEETEVWSAPAEEEAPKVKKSAPKEEASLDSLLDEVGGDEDETPAPKAAKAKPAAKDDDDDLDSLFSDLGLDDDEDAA